MVAPALRIGRLETRVRVPGAAEALAAGRLVEAAAARLGPALEAALPRVMAEAGLAEDSLVSVPRLALRLRLRGEVDAARLGAAWGEALAEALARALHARSGAEGAPPGARRPGPDRPAGPRSGEAAPLAAEGWAAEWALLATLEAGRPAPWWAEAVAPGLAAPGGPAALLASWIARDPARAAAAMARLLPAAPGLAARLSAREAAGLAAAFRDALRRALGASVAAPLPPAGPDAAALSALPGALPAATRAALGTLAPDLRPPWLIAALLAGAPRFAAALEALLPFLAAAPAAFWHGADAPSPARLPAAGTPPAAASTWPPPLPEARPLASASVLAGGLLLLLRPLAALRPAWLADADALPGRLRAFGLLVLHRLTAPLPPAARDAALERDRPLLAVFTGASPPATRLGDQLPAGGAALEAEEALARLLASAPPGVRHAPGALRRLFGARDPFAADPAGDLLCRLVLRPGRLRWDDSLADLAWPHEAADAALRRAGWDLDPGWLPWIGRRVAFRYGAEEAQ